MAVEMDDIVVIARLLSVAEHFAHTCQCRRPAEVKLHIRSQRIKCGKQCFRRDTGIDESGILGSADDVQNPQRQPFFAGREFATDLKDRHRNNCRFPDVEHVFNVLGTMESCPTYF